jgi:hypothetical protein
MGAGPDRCAERGRAAVAFAGATFFVPTAGMLDELTQPPAVPASEAPANGSLGIGSLRDET